MEQWKIQEWNIFLFPQQEQEKISDRKNMSTEKKTKSNPKSSFI